MLLQIDNTRKQEINQVLESLTPIAPKQTLPETISSALPSPICDESEFLTCQFEFFPSSYYFEIFFTSVVAISV